MEINLEGRLRRTEQLVRPDGGKKDTAEAASPAAAQPRTDSLTLARQAVEQLTEQNQRIMALIQQDQETGKKPFLWNMLDGEEETGSSEADALGEQMKTMERCHKIASRIMRGDKVPPQDEQYLMQNDPEGYKLVLAMRKPKRHPKKWESVLKDEEKRTEESGGGEETPSCEAAGETSGGDCGETSDSGGAPSGGE